MDGEDGNELKLEKDTDSEMVSAESRQKLKALCAINIFHVLSVGCQECCTCELNFTQQQIKPDSAPLSRGRK